jgi:hypothetical protein
MGIRICSHWKGNIKLTKAIHTLTNVFLLEDIKKTFLSNRRPSHNKRIVSIDNLKNNISRSSL